MLIYISDITYIQSITETRLDKMIIIMLKDISNNMIDNNLDILINLGHSTAVTAKVVVYHSSLAQIRNDPY